MIFQDFKQCTDNASNVSYASRMEPDSLNRLLLLNYHFLTLRTVLFDVNWLYFPHIVRLRIDSPTRIVMLGRDTRIHNDGRIKTLYKENTKYIEQMYGPSSLFNSIDKHKFRSDLKRFNFVTGMWIVAPHRNI